MSSQTPLQVQTKKINIEGKKFNVYVAEFNPSVNSIELKLASNNLNKMRSAKSMRGKSQVSINASYFKQDSGLPLGLVVINHEIITSPILNRVAFGVDDSGNPIIDIPELEGNVSIGGKDLRIFYKNQPLFNCEGVTILDNRYNTYLPRLNKNFKFVEVVGNKVINISSTKSRTDKSSILLISSRFPKDLKIGDEVSINYGLKDKFSKIKYGVSGGTILIKNGRVNVDYREEGFSLPFVKSVRPRTAIGYTAFGNVKIVIIGSANLFDEAKIMKALGCVEAMNFDGGSSTQMETNRGHIGSHRGVSTVLCVN